MKKYPEEMTKEELKKFCEELSRRGKKGKAIPFFDWQIKNLEKEAKGYISKFRKTKKATYLYKASKNVWEAYKIHVKRLSGKEPKDYKDTKRLTKSLVKKKRLSMELFDKMAWLYIFSHGCWIGEDPKFFIKQINDCLKMIKK